MKRILIAIMLSLYSATLSSQVTIGSGFPPSQGALLDLKQRNVNNGDANSNKGLLLPRVELSKLKPLVGKLSESIGNAGTWGEKEHTGLMVYNAKNTFDLCLGGAYEGVYSWTGTEWLALYQKRSKAPSTDVSTDEFDGANSCIISPNSSLSIPIKRAYDIWNAYTGTDANAPTGKVLDKTNANGLTGTLTANIVWQEGSAVSTATISGNGNAATLNIQSGSTGNALVQVLIGGKVLWQWHIWVTADNLLNTAKLYRKNGIEEWHMDRFLGANSATGSGLFYQWGRNVPLPNIGNVETLTATDSEGKNLANAIQSEMFITYASADSHDWYSATKKQWDARWGDLTSGNTKKSPFDPCPRGWRVPSASTDGKPWECIENVDEETRGHFPLGGYLSNGDGSLGDVGVSGYMWSASPLTSMAAILFYDGSKMDTWTNYNRANAMNVRCVKEK